MYNEISIKKYKLLLPLLIAAALLTGSACSKSSGGKNTDPGQGSGGTISENAGYMPEKPGTVLTYTITAGDEAGTGMAALFRDVHDSSGYTVGTLDMTIAAMKLYEAVRHNKAYTYTTSYLSPTYYESLQKVAAGYSSFTHQETPIVMKLPHNNPLKQIVFPTMTSASWHGVKNEDDGDGVMDSKMTQTEHQAVIDSTATIKTAAGTYIDCIRVHFLRDQRVVTEFHSSYDNYSFDNTVHFDIMIWMAKGIGPVKSKELNLNTGVFSVTELTKVEFPK